MKQQRKKKSTRGRPSRRPEIIAATEALIRTRGLASTTTRAIAEQAGCSEARSTSTSTTVSPCS